MRMPVWLAAASLALCVAAAPVAAREVQVETKVALEDHSELAIKQALRDAFQISVRGALAMGLSHVSVDGARVLLDAVVLGLVATDDVDAADETRGE